MFKHINELCIYFYVLRFAFHSILYALREPVFQSMNKFSLSVLFFCTYTFAHAASMECHASPATRVSQLLEGESGVEQMN